MAAMFLGLLRCCVAGISELITLVVIRHSVVVHLGRFDLLQLEETYRAMDMKQMKMVIKCGVTLTKVQTLGELRMRGSIDGLGFVLVVSR